MQEAGMQKEGPKTAAEFGAEGGRIHTVSEGLLLCPLLSTLQAFCTSVVPLRIFAPTQLFRASQNLLGRLALAPF